MGVLDQRDTTFPVARSYKALWPLIDTWPDLRCEGKRAWLDLCELCPEGRSSLETTLAVLMERWDVSHSSVRRRLASLRQRGLISFELDHGNLSIEIHDPLSVPRIDVAHAGPR